MIQVEVYVPAIDRLFEFEINEHATVASIIEGLVSMVSSQAGRSWAEGAMPLLCSAEGETVLPLQKTLEMQVRS